MPGPAGPCEWCGGPQHWTIISGDVYVSCDGGCLPLDLEGVVPPPGSVCALDEVGGSKAAMEPSGCQGVGPLERGESNTSDTEVESKVAAVPPWFLDVMWEGGAEPDG